MRQRIIEKINRFIYHFILVLIYAYILAPVIIIVLVSFNPTELLVIPIKNFSIKWYLEFLDAPGFISAFKFSIKLGLAAAILTPIIGIPSAYAIVRYEFRYKDLVEVFLLSPILVPSIITGLSLLIFFVHLDLRGSFLSMLICHIVLTVPFVMRTVIASLSGVDIAVEEAAQILGANRFQVFTKITLPLMSSGVVAGIIFVFVISFGEVNASLFVSGIKTVTLPVQIFCYLKMSSSPIITAISAIQIFIICAAAVVIEKLLGLGKAMQYG